VADVFSALDTPMGSVDVRPVGACARLGIGCVGNDHGARLGAGWRVVAGFCHHVGQAGKRRKAMPCNLAVSITKAAVENEELLRFMTPDVVEGMLAQALGVQGRIQGDTVTFTLNRKGRPIVTVQNGQVNVQANRSRVPKDQVEALSEQVAQKLVDIGTAALAAKMYQALQRYGSVNIQSTQVDNEGLQQAAQKLVVTTGSGVEIRLFVLPGGQMQVMVDGQVSFDQAREVTAKLLEAARAQVASLQQTSEVEQHKAGVTHVHERQHLHGGHA